MSVVRQDSFGAANEPSPSVWGDCPNSLLNDLGLGYFVDARFGGTATATAAADGAALDKDVRLANGTGNVAITDAALDGGGIIVATANGDNDQAVVATPTLGPIVRNSGKKLWAEAMVAPGDVDADMATFFGIVEAASITGEVLADDVAADCLVTESAIGFLQDNGNDDAYDIVLRKDGGTVVTILADATNSAAITAARSRATSIEADDLISEPKAAASLTDAALWKLAIKFDGLKTLYFYVEGVQVAKYEVDSTVDQTHSYAAVVAIKTGTTAAEQITIRRLRAAYQERT